MVLSKRWAPLSRYLNIPRAKRPGALSGVPRTNSESGGTGLCQVEKKEKLDALFALIARIDNPEDCRALFDDLCTVKEIENMAERIFVAKLLLEGKTYNQIMAESDISSATLSRVSRCVQYGKGYSKLLKK